MKLLCAFAFFSVVGFVAAAEKAQKVAQELMLEVRAAEERKLVYKEILEKSNK